MQSITNQVTTMKAAILTQQNHPLVIDTVVLPEALSFGQVLVKVTCSSICGSQLGEIQGVKGKDKYLPHLLGHEGSGVVVDAGPGVTTVKKEDHVVMHWKGGAGIQSAPPTYRWREKPLNAGWVTTFSEYSIVSENRITVIPKDLDMEIAALMGCAVTTGLGIINNDAQVKIGESVVVLGSGGVGLCEILGASMVSAFPIIAVDLFPKKLQLAKQLGATHLVNGSGDSLQETLSNLLQGCKADVVIENTGNTRLIEMAYELTHPQGRTILVGVPKAGYKTHLYSLPLHFGKELKGSHGGDAKPHEDIPRYVKLCREGMLPLKKMITHRFSLDEINLAIEKMKKGEISGRCMLTP